MCANISVQKHNKISISAGPILSSIEIADSAISAGFLTQFPGASLAIFLYLVTHVDNNNFIKTNPTIISSYLADDFQITDINQGLNFLQKNAIIDISSEREGDYSYDIRLNLNNLNNIINDIKFSNKDSSHDEEENLSAEKKQQARETNIQANNSSRYFNNPYYDKTQIRIDVLAIPDVSRAELFKAILTFIPPEENIDLLENRINQWLEDFDVKMVKELIRRVNKWLEKYNNPADKGFHYLKGIVDDWYKKDIRKYEDLQYHDQIYRETREIASLYGLTEWHNIKPTHMKTFNKWLKGGFPLSVEIIKLAIQEAFRRKKDGQPSLQYIEDNFIMPWKEKKIRTSKQALRILNKSKSQSENKKQSKDNQINSNRNDINKQRSNTDKWDNLNWDFQE
ncbi:MAG: DnaD domain protein [Halanaerobiaceae bacterium]